MKLWKKTAAAVLAATVCTSLAGCGMNDKSMWDAMETASKKAYNSGTFKMTVDSKENLLDELGMSSDMFGVDSVNKVGVSFQIAQQDATKASVIVNGSINDQEETALGEIRFIDDTYYFNVDPLGDLLDSSSNAYMKVVGALLPDDQWIEFSAKDLEEYTGQEMPDMQKQELKDQTKLALSTSETIVSLMEEICGNDYVTKEDNKFTLSLDKDAVNAIVENAVHMEQEKQSLTNAVESIDDAFSKYGNDYLVESFATLKGELLNQLAVIADADYVPEKMTEDGTMSISIENKKSTSEINWSFVTEEVTAGYEIELSKGKKTEVAVPENTISIQEFMQTLSQF